ncbi:MAG: leucine-rich repeat domain-containing protein [Bacilli bacterium]|nr:leucine-rich repeat domain-containing protein [Bacilli bacterium]
MKKYFYLITPLMCVPMLVGCGQTKYTVTWKNYDGTVLEVDENVVEGAMPEYNSATPLKNSDKYCNYTFSGWDKKLEKVHSDQTYIATFETELDSSVTAFGISLKRNLDFSFRAITAVEGKSLTINWGDGTPENSESSHSYQNEGNYTILVLNVDKFNCEGNGSIVSANIGSTVKEIDNNAFFQCEKLESAKMQDSVTSIGKGAFYQCSALSDFEISNSVQTIGSSAFTGCDSLKKAYIPASVESIGTYVYKGCTSLEEIVVDPENKKFDSRDNCNSLIDTEKSTLLAGSSNSTIPNGNKKIAEYSFAELKDLKSIVIPDSVTSIGDYAFLRCRHLKSATLPDSITHFGLSSFAECATLETIHIPSSVKEIPYDCFFRCFKLDGVTIPSSVTKIGVNAFFECSTLKSIFIPKTVTSIAEYAFFGCSSLTIYCEAEEKPAGWNDDWNHDNRPVHWGCQPE